MRWTAVAIGMTIAAFVIAVAWMVSVMNQPIAITITVSPAPPSRPGWWAFQYAAPLLGAFILAVGAVVSVNVRPPANRVVRLAISVVAGLEVLVFGAVWFSLL
jgi:hypothetical protein